MAGTAATALPEVEGEGFAAAALSAAVVSWAQEVKRVTVRMVVVVGVAVAVASSAR